MRLLAIAVKKLITKQGITRAFIVFLVMVIAACTNSPIIESGEKAADDKRLTSPLQLSKHQQLVLVISDDWQADNAQLYRFDKKLGQWQQQGEQTQVTLGRTGLAWGIGLHGKQQGKIKQEGDGKAPAGIFTLGDAFGYLSKLNTAMPYKEMTANDFCIDVNDSPFYNQIVSKLEVGEQGIRGSSEPMRRDIHLAGDHKYKKGLIVQHNSEQISGAGSCIFMHIWQAPTLPTAGCTAMSEKNITELLTWLNGKKQPLYVALPRSEYLAKKLAWSLPDLANQLDHK